MALRTESDLQTCPRLGASWEGFALEEVCRRKRVRSGEAHFWATHEEAELDLLLVEGGKRSGYEFKYTDAPKSTRSMHRAIVALGLQTLTVVVPSGSPNLIIEKIRVLPLDDV
jgi:predicted AAA+ superfamily ATPase